MKDEFLPTDRDGKLFQLSEECAEVIIEISKAGRFGMESFHPDDPTRCNARRILDEIQDVKNAISFIEGELIRFAENWEKNR